MLSSNSLREQGGTCYRAAAKSQAQADLYLASSEVDWNNLREEIQPVIPTMIVVEDPATVAQKFRDWKQLGAGEFGVITNGKPASS